jgi:hypothetical protein
MSVRTLTCHVAKHFVHDDSNTVIYPEHEQCVSFHNLVRLVLHVHPPKSDLKSIQRLIRTLDVPQLGTLKLIVCMGNRSSEQRCSLTNDRKVTSREIKAINFPSLKAVLLDVAHEAECLPPE